MMLPPKLSPWLSAERAFHECCYCTRACESCVMWGTRENQGDREERGNRCRGVSALVQ